jgi:hypothetical protein
VSVAVEFEAEREYRRDAAARSYRLKERDGRERGWGSHKRATGAILIRGDGMVAIVMRNAVAHGLFVESMCTVWGG